LPFPEAFLPAVLLDEEVLAPLDGGGETLPALFFALFFVFLVFVMCNP
jgi:hypothetical protein